MKNTSSKIVQLLGTLIVVAAAVLITEERIIRGGLALLGLTMAISGFIIHNKKNKKHGI